MVTLFTEPIIVKFFLKKDNKESLMCFFNQFPSPTFASHHAGFQHVPALGAEEVLVILRLWPDGGVQCTHWCFQAEICVAYRIGGRGSKFKTGFCNKI